MGTVEARQDGRLIAILHPEKRFYQIQPDPLTEAGIRPGFFRDLYVSLGEPLGVSGAWSMRIHVKPFVRWIWLGAIFMAIGATLALTDQRFSVLRRKSAEASSMAASKV